MEIDKEKYLKRLKMVYPITLFEPDFKVLDKKGCPVCGHKLKYAFTKKTYYCNRHKRTFAIKAIKLD